MRKKGSPKYYVTMFWNAEFLDSSPSHIDVMLQIPTVKLSDILFEDDLLQELKTSNPNLANFLNSPEIITELVDNITQLTEKDCCDKLVYSKVHAAYISCEILTSGSLDVFAILMSRPESLNKVISCLTVEPKENLVDEDNQLSEEELLKLCRLDDQKDENQSMDCRLDLSTKVVPQKANLVSKLISAIHSVAPAVLSCHISQNIELFTRLIDLLVNNVDVSGSFEILCTFIKPTSTIQQQSTELRYSFCEILGKLNFVDKLIDVMTNSDCDDKQRNACQLLCDIIVFGRQCAADQKNQPASFDLLSELLQSKDRVTTILEQMFSKEERNLTAIICGMKVLQTLIEKKTITDAPLVTKAIGEAQEALEKYLIHFHELLLNPPKQEPIKTTFGIIQRPLGYIRLEVVNLIRALISTNSAIVIKKLVELKTMKVIIDLFIEYFWNNLLHTQVEKALCLIINNNRGDEESYYQAQIDTHMQEHILNNQISTEVNTETDIVIEQREPDQEQSGGGFPESGGGFPQSGGGFPESGVGFPESGGGFPESGGGFPEFKPEQPATEFPSRALLSQILNDCDLIGRLLSPCGLTNGNINGTIVDDQDTNSNNKENTSLHDSNNKENSDEIVLTLSSNKSESSENLRQIELGRQRRRNGEQANFGHIIKMINSIAINRDLDTIRDHLNEMKDKRPDLHDRWTTFVDVDVASFKEISLFYDVRSASNNVNHRFGLNNQMSNNQNLMDSSNSSHMNSLNDNENNQNNNEDHNRAYLSFTKEIVLPQINVDVLPRMKHSTKQHILERIMRDAK